MSSATVRFLVFRTVTAVLVERPAAVERVARDEEREVGGWSVTEVAEGGLVAMVDAFTPRDLAVPTID